MGLDLDRPEFARLRTLQAIFIDFDSFFASCEQQRDPALRGKPVGIVPVKTKHTCCIAASYEAKRHGIKTGTSIREARRLCPEIRFVHAEHRVYIEYQQQALEAIDRCAPVWGVHSIDELSIRLCPRTRERDAAIALAREIKHALAESIGPFVRCSVGIAPNRFLAKQACSLDKPNGLTIIDRTNLAERLFERPTEKLTGIGHNMARRLRAHQMHTVSDLYRATNAQLRRAWEGVLGDLWWHQLRGGTDWYDRPTSRSSLGHQHVMAPEFRTPEGARAVAIRLLTKAAARLRDEGYHTTRLHAAVRFEDRSRWGAETDLEPTRDTLVLHRAFAQLWKLPPGRTPKQVSVVFTGLTDSRSVEEPLFVPAQRSDGLSSTLDRITRRYGYDAIYPGSMHAAKKAAPRRIAFGNVPDLNLPDAEQ